MSYTNKQAFKGQWRRHNIDLNDNRQQLYNENMIAI